MANLLTSDIRERIRNTVAIGELNQIKFILILKTNGLNSDEEAKILV